MPFCDQSLTICLQMLSDLDNSKKNVVWYRVNPFPNDNFMTLPNSKSL